MGRVEVDFHLRHIEFRVNGEPVYRPCIPWEQAVEECTEWFLYILAITVAPLDLYEEVQQEIFRRLESTAVPEEDRTFISCCLAYHVCSLPDDNCLPEEVMPNVLWADDGDRLFRCVWMENGDVLVLSEMTSSGRQERGRYDLAPGQDPVETALQVLKQAVAPEHYSLNLLRELPLDVYVLPNDGPEYVLKQEGVRETEAEMDLH